MALDPTEWHEAKTSPMQLAHNPLFTAREKIDMLNELRAEVTGEHANPDQLGYDPDEIDAAIAEIKLEVQDGSRPEVSFAGGRDEQRDDRPGTDHLEPEAAADEELKLETEIAQATGIVSPMSWWRIGLVALFLIAAILLAIQLLGGNKGTGVIPGTPVAAPQTEAPVSQS